MPRWRTRERRKAGRSTRASRPSGWGASSVACSATNSTAGRFSHFAAPPELPSKARAADLLSADLEAVAQEAARRVREDRPSTERELQEFARARWAQEGFETEGWPGVAVDAHTADPHYSPLAEGGTVAGRNSLLLLDFSARLAPAGIYGDLTRVYFLGESVPEEMQRIAGHVL